MISCNVTYCLNCVTKAIDFMFDSSSPQCFNFRGAIRPYTYWAKTIKPNDQRYWLLNALATAYLNGNCGLKKNIKKGMRLLTRAAETGDIAAKDQLAEVYFHGKGSSVPVHFEKARYYAEQAADKGYAMSQYIIVKLLLLGF